MRASAVFLGALLALATAVPSALAQTAPSLTIYVIDVEGGNATLFVGPTGQSVLIDTGNGGANAARDAGRIVQAVKDAGLTQIDYLITTHYHGDHYGGMTELVRQVPVMHFVDHGENVQPSDNNDAFMKAYAGLYAKATRTVVQPGDTLPVAGLDWTIVASAGQGLTTALPGAGSANPFCAGVERMNDDPTENAQSVSSHISFGKFRVVHMGDLTWNKELDIVCPNNLLGTAELFVVTHHGQPVSNAPPFVHALQPRVAIINNGTQKGGQPDAMRVLFNSPGLEDIWQIHFSRLSGQEYTVPGAFIANTIDDPQDSLPIAPYELPPPGERPPAPEHNGTAYWFKVTAMEDGTFTVTNTRNDFTKTYRPRTMGTN